MGASRRVLMYNKDMDGLVGKAVIADDFPRVPTPGNPLGTSVPAYDEMMKRVGFVEAGVPMLVIEDNMTIFVKVLGPVGPVWVMKKDVKRLI